MSTTQKKTIATNAKTLSKSLLEVYNDLLMDKITLPKAKEASNVAGKVIKNNLGRLEYKGLTKSNVEIDFWQE